jgi:hypothetical protein
MVEMTHTKADYQRCSDLIPSRSTLDNDFYWSQVAEWLDQNEHIIRSALALAASDTHVWVPREPTEKMLVDIAAACRNFHSEDGPYPRSKAAYKAMITAVEGK